MKINSYNFKLHYHYVPSERKRGLDALSKAKGQYYIPNNNNHVSFRGTGACPLFRVYGFDIDEFVNFRTDPLAVGSRVKF